MPPIENSNPVGWDLDLLRTFVAVVDTGGFTRAGERVGRTQSTISQQIRKLEEGLGCRLLQRRGTAISLTEEGEILLGYARRLMLISAEARDALLRPSGQTIVRLGVTEDFAGRRLTNLLSHHIRSHPHIRLDVTSAWSFELERLLETGELDVAIIKRGAGVGGSHAHWPERLAWVCGANCDPTLDPVPLALFPAGCIYRARAIEALEAAGRRWRVAFAGQGLAGVQAAIASDIGIGLLAADVVQDNLQRLHVLKGFPEPDATEVALVIRKGRLPTAVKGVVAWLEEQSGLLFPQ